MSDSSSHSESGCIKPEVLLVEDQQDVRTVFALMLSSQGFEVTELGCGKLARERFEQRLPTVALIDANLNGLDGLTLGSFVRALPGGDDVLLGTLTGNETLACRTKAIENGFDFHFVKPIRLKEVCDVIKNRLAGSPSPANCPWALDKS